MSSATPEHQAFQESGSGAPAAGIRRRNYPRIATHAPIELWFRETGSFLLADLHNVSRGGACIKTPVRFSVDMPVLLKLRLPGDGAVMMIKGRVAWSSFGDTQEDAAGGMGVEFIRVQQADSTEQNTCIERYFLEYKARRTYQQNHP